MRRISASVSSATRETERRITRGEARHPQDAHRVFGESLGDMPQLPRLEVAQSAIGIDDLARLVFGHGVDGQVAALEIVLEGDVRRKLGGEAAITRRHLALQPGERVFFLGLRDAGTPGNRGPPERYPSSFEPGRRRAHDHPVALPDLAAEKPVPNRAAYQVHLHSHMLPDVRMEPCSAHALSCRAAM